MSLVITATFENGVFGEAAHGVACAAGIHARLL
jgi:hypothetical protein